MTYRSNSSRYPTPDEIHNKYGYKFWVHHIHSGNDPDYKRREEFSFPGAPIPEYVTTCEITDIDDKTVLGYGIAICNPRDIPNRRLGHEIAVTRAIKDLMSTLEVPPKPQSNVVKFSLTNKAEEPITESMVEALRG